MTREDTSIIVWLDKDKNDEVYSISSHQIIINTVIQEEREEEIRVARGSQMWSCKEYIVSC